MRCKPSTGICVVASALLVSLAGPSIASAHYGNDGRHHHCHHRDGNGETPLTGSTLASAEQAAVNANPGATAKGASTETDSNMSNAAYEVFIFKADGHWAKVIEDANFNILATVTKHHSRRHDRRFQPDQRSRDSRYSRFERRHHHCH